MKIKWITLLIIGIAIGICIALFINTTSQEYIEQNEVLNENEYNGIDISNNVIIKNGEIQNENLIDEFINNSADEKKELNIEYNDEVVKVKFTPKEENYENNVGDGTFESNKKIYGYYSLTKNDENIGEYPLNTWYIRKKIKDNQVILRFDMILAEYISEEKLPQICSYNILSSKYERKFELNYSQRKDLGIEEIYDNGEYKLKTFGGDVSVTIEEDMVYSLNDALNQGIITCEDIIAQANLDKEYGICDIGYYKDGGSTEYYYNRYTILKMNSLSGDNDLVIGMQGAIINSYNKNK